jgi:Tol biopolymer transport system component
MTLQVGARLGPYEIVGAIGAGGMGEVYRAKDTKLGREVAIKVLPAAFAQDPERLARFEREARLLASLNHPSIAHVYGFESAALDDGSKVHFLAMELVAGEDLSQRLKGGAIQVEDAIAISKQIAEGLEEAHDKGIVHRDLKPANIKLAPDGKVKILDFGLAKAWAADAPVGSAPEISHSPTMTRQGTEAGMILGTAAYMSPEQARGKPLDKRADIWAFGVVLYEMVTGTRLFAGETVSDVLAAVLRAEVDWKSLPSGVPTELRRLLGRCLERDPKNRLHDIADARIAIDEMIRGGMEPAPAGAHAHQASDRRSLLPWLLAAGAVTVAMGLGLRSGGTRRPGPTPLTAFGVQVPPQNLLTRAQSPILDLSNDGRTLLFVAEGEHAASVFRRTFDRMAVTRVQGTEGAENPALSPDGRWIAFFAGGQLRKISAEGGASVVLAGALAPRGLAWGRDGSIIFSPLYTGGLFRVSAAGGEPVSVTSVAKGERSHRWPQVLPDGRTVIFTVGNADSPGDYDGSNIEAQRLDTGERRTILKGARMARYSSIGYLLFQRGQTLLAVKFDPKRLETEGQPFTVQEGVGGDPSSGACYFSVSDNGVVVVAPEASIPATRLLVLVDRTGHETVLNAPPASFFHPRFSPDGKRLAFAIGTGSASDDDIYTIELATQRMQRLTFGQGHGFPLWNPDGKRILFTNGRTGETGIGMKAADGSGEDILVLKRSEFQLADSWHPDGRRLAITDATHSIDIRILDTAKGGELTPLFANPSAGESAAAFSPDGRYIAYQTTETGTDEVVVETFPPGGGKWQISVAGGITPVWARDGRALYFVTGQAVMAVDVDTRGVFRPGEPHPLFTGPYDLHTVVQRNFDVGPDGRFAMVRRQVGSISSGEILVLEGWSSLDPGRAGSGQD